VIARRNAARQFLPPVLIFREINKKEEFHDALPPGSDVYMNWKLSYIGTDLFFERFTGHFLKHKA